MGLDLRGREVVVHRVERRADVPPVKLGDTLTQGKVEIYQIGRTQVLIREHEAIEAVFELAEITKQLDGLRTQQERLSKEKDRLDAILGHFALKDEE